MNDNNTLADDLRERIRDLEAQLERSRSTNVYDGNAHRRVSELETELAISKGREEGKQIVINLLEAALKRANEKLDFEGLEPVLPQAETHANSAKVTVQSRCEREGHVWVEVGPSSAPWQVCDECRVKRPEAETFDEQHARIVNETADAIASEMNRGDEHG